MKRSKRIGILAVILVVACVATWAMTRYEEKQEEIRNTDEVILEIPYDTVQTISWEIGEDGLAFRRGEHGWLYEDDQAFPVSEEKMEDVLTGFEGLGASFIIENVEDYGQYGLDDPEAVIYLSTEARDYEIKLGDFSKMDEKRYVDLGDGNVYLLSADPLDWLETELSALIQHDTIPDWDQVEQLTFAGAEDYTICYAATEWNEEEDTDKDGGDTQATALTKAEWEKYRKSTYSDADVYFTEKNGEILPLDTDTVEDYLDAITALSLYEYVTYNATEEGLASFGLDTPELTITLQYTAEEEEQIQDDSQQGNCVIHIGRNPEELAAAKEAEAEGEEEIPDVTSYVRVGDSQIVYELSETSYETLVACAYHDLRHDQVFWADFDLVTQINVTLEGEDHLLISTLDEEVDDNERLWYYGEASLGEEINIKYLQDALEVLSADSFTEEIPTEKEEIRLTLQLEDDNFPQVTLAFYRYDGSHCLAVIDGETVSLVERSDVMDLVETVQEIVLSK